MEDRARLPHRRGAHAWRTCATVWLAALKSNLQVAVDIKFVEPKTIARSEGKAKRVIDLRGENQ